MEQIFIRPMTKDDLHKVVETEKLCFSDPWSEQSFDDGMNNEYQKYWNRSIFVIVKPYYLALYIKYLIENKENLINNIPIIKKKIQKEFKKSYEIPNYQFK